MKADVDKVKAITNKDVSVSIDVMDKNGKLNYKVKVNTANKTVKENKSAKFKFDKGLNMDNVKSVKYSTTNKKVATVSKSGKIKAKDAGKVTVKVTLLNGKTKTVKMTIKVK